MTYDYPIHPTNFGLKFKKKKILLAKLALKSFFYEENNQFLLMENAFRDLNP